MINSKKIYSLFSLQFLVVLVLIASRLLPHPPNFTPIISAAILCGFFFNSWIMGLFIIILSMFVTDLFLGFHSNMFFIYFSFVLISLYSNYFIQTLKTKNIYIHCIVSSLIFFIVSNFGVWFLGNLYPKNIYGLYDCYLMAIPFFSNTVISTIFFTYLYFFCNKSLLEKYQ